MSKKYTFGKIYDGLFPDGELTDWRVEVAKRFDQFYLEVKEKLQILEFRNEKECFDFAKRNFNFHVKVSFTNKIRRGVKFRGHRYRFKRYSLRKETTRGGACLESRVVGWFDEDLGVFVKDLPIKLRYKLESSFCVYQSLNPKREEWANVLDLHNISVTSGSQERLIEKVFTEIVMNTWCGENYRFKNEEILSEAIAFLDREEVQKIRKPTVYDVFRGPLSLNVYRWIYGSWEYASVRSFRLNKAFTEIDQYLSNSRQTRYLDSKRLYEVEDGELQKYKERVERYGVWGDK